MSSWFKSKVQKVGSRLESYSKPTAVKPPEPAPQTPTPQNSTLLQAFEWHTPGGHWIRLSNSLETLAGIGITSFWLPPGCKANSPQGNGYDCYDLWDLGEFDQKWTRATKWGSREELNEMMAKAKSLGVKIIWDAVLNHKTAGDATEECWAVECDKDNRNIETSEAKKIEAWIHFNFPGRGDQYSSMKWHARHFNGTDWDQRGQKNAVYKIVDAPEDLPRPGAPVDPNWRKKGWAGDVDDLWGNADYLMFSNVDFANAEVREDVTRWGQWMVNEVGIDGFRLDAVPHMSWMFIREWIRIAMEAAQHQQRELFIMGEFLNRNPKKILQWMDRMGQGVKAYDIPLLNNFAKLSMAKNKLEVDLRKVFKNTLIQFRPADAVTMVTSHDTQPGQAVETPVAPYFKSLAYALMLLRREGTPCVFYGDLYGIQGPHAESAACDGKLPNLVLSRKLFAYGEQVDYFDSRTSIGWVRHGTWDRADGCAVIMSIGNGAKNTMFVGANKAGQTWTDVLGNWKGAVTIDGRGYGTFSCTTKSVSVFVRQDAPGRQEFDACCGPEKFVTQC